ncbi:MAG: hypothetical protein KH333_02380, partial [Clostridium sp.]|nr:hypothetical protein [Clostridium sp.]
ETATGMAISGAASKVAKKFQNSKINQKLTKKLDDVTSSLKSKTKNITANIAKKTKEATKKAVNTVSDKAKNIANKTLGGTNTVKNAINNVPKSAKNKVTSVIDSLGEGILSVRNVFAPQKVINVEPIKIAVKDIKTGFGQSGEETLSQFLSKDVKKLKTMFFSQGNKSGSNTYYFIGTTEGYAGNSALQRLEITPTSTDPLVSTVFATNGEQYGKGVLYISSADDLKGVSYTASNVLSSYEKEVCFNMQPLEFANKSRISISASDARAILKDMGYDIPSRITIGDMSEFLSNAPSLTTDEILKFVEKAGGIQ